MSTQDWTITGGMDDVNGDFTNLVEDYSGMVRSVRRSMGIYAAAPDGDVVRDYSPKPAKCGKLLKGQHAPDSRPTRGRYMAAVMGQIMAQTGNPYTTMTPDQKALQELALILAEWTRKRTTRSPWYAYMQEPIEHDAEETAAVFVLTAQMYHEEWLQILMEPQETEEAQQEARLAILKNAINTAWTGLHVTLGVQVSSSSNRTRIRVDADSIDEAEEDSPVYTVEDEEAVRSVERMEAYDAAWQQLEADVLTYLTSWERAALMDYLNDNPDPDMLDQVAKMLRDRMKKAKEYGVDRDVRRLKWLASKNPISFPWLNYSVA